MIKLTPAAAEQIKHAMAPSDSAGMALRLAVEKKQDGSFHYLMGFDEKSDGDLSWDYDDVTVICSPEQEPMLTGTTVDFVEIEPGQKHFIFINPNDPNCSL